MAIKFGNNIKALGVLQNLSKASGLGETAMERLSSGMRINSAKDDPGGLAIASSLNADSRVFSQGMRNVQDGISAIATASSAVEALSDILNRINELAEQSANGVYSSTQRSQLQSEADALVSEYNRIITTTEFNGVSLLNNPDEQISIQVGYGDVDRGGQIIVPLPGGSTSDDVQFADAVAYSVPLSADPSVGSTENEILIADFDGDGNQDLVVDDYGEINVFLGNGDGTFKERLSYDYGSTRTNRGSFGDIDGDGDLDIVYAYNKDHIQVFTNNGDGTIASNLYVAGLASQDVQLADANNDDVLDLVVIGSRSDPSQRYMTTFLGNGDGTFQAFITSSATGTRGRDIEVADLDGDGNVDAVTTHDSFTSFVLFGDGTGMFSTRVTYNDDAFDREIVDVNNDGHLDFVSVNQTGRIRTYLNDGTGTFTVAASTTNPAGNIDVRQFSVGDFNDDGNVDVVTGETTDNGDGIKFSLFLGDGAGNFEHSSDWETGAAEATQIAVGDFNNDGKDDVVTSSFADGALYVSLNETPGSLTLGEIDISTQSAAQTALGIIESKTDVVRNTQAELGASESRLSVVYESLASKKENFKSAASQILDADVAQEVANLVRSNILKQAGAAMLAQANVNSQIALELLS